MTVLLSLYKQLKTISFLIHFQQLNVKQKCNADKGLASKIAFTALSCILFTGLFKVKMRSRLLVILKSFFLIKMHHFKGSVMHQ